MVFCLNFFQSSLETHLYALHATYKVQPRKIGGARRRRRQFVADILTIICHKKFCQFKVNDSSKLTFYLNL